MPKIYKADSKHYKDMGLKDLADEMFASMKRLATTRKLSAGFSVLPHPDVTPVEAYEKLVKNEIESLTLKQMAGKTVATGDSAFNAG